MIFHPIKHTHIGTVYIDVAFEFPAGEGRAYQIQAHQTSALVLMEPSNGETQLGTTLYCEQTRGNTPFECVTRLVTHAQPHTYDWADAVRHGLRSGTEKVGRVTLFNQYKVVPRNEVAGFKIGDSEIYAIVNADGTFLRGRHGIIFE